MEENKVKWTELLSKFNIGNLLFCYCLPFFYVFYPTLFMPAIFLRSLSFVIGWLYKLISSHHHHTNINSPQKGMEELDEDRNHMYFWLQRCSICLDNTYNLCLNSCRDQFCKDCFSRYIKETVNQSWGLGVTRIKCPVCQDIIQQNEWSKYVSKDIVERYNKFNQPYRPFSRHCFNCQSSVSPCSSFKNQSITRERQFEIINKELESLGLPSIDKNNNKIQVIYHQVIPTLSQLVNKKPNLYSKAASISKQIVSMEILPEAWKQIQFWHITNFPQEICQQCNDPICLQCGEYGHLGSTCLENLKLKLKKNNLNQELVQTIQWKLNHTRPCPNCSVMINRDEGCNKVDCLLCGYKFCWRCGSSWSQQKCGFYQCKEQDTLLLSEDVNNLKAELGVPDMQAIDARRLTNSL